MKKVRKFLSIFFIVCFCLQTLIGCSSNKDNGYYNGIKWGTSIDKLKNELGDNITVSDDNESILQMIENYNGMDGILGSVMYYFDNSELSKITITIASNSDKSNISDEELNRNLYDEFINKYGECSNSNSMEYEWNTQYSNISLSIANYIQYEPID